MKFQNCQIEINRSRIMVEKGSLSFSNKISPSYSLGGASKIGHKHDGPINGTIQFDYFIEVDNEPIYSIVTGLKAYQSSHQNAVINIAGTNFSGYLNSYRFNVSPNNLISASADFSVFAQFNNTFLDIDPWYDRYNTTNSSGLAHYWTSKVVNNNNTGNIIEAGYNFTARWEPRYKIGNPYPYEISFLSAEEKIELLSEYDVRVKFSGQSLTGFDSSLNEIRLSSISGLYNNTNSYLSFPIGEAQIVQSSIDLSNNIIVNNVSAINNF